MYVPKTILMMMMLAVASGSAAAAWVVLGENDTSVVYFDPATIRKADNTVTMWTLFDLKKTRVVDVFSYASSRAQYEYDCKQVRVRLLDSSLYSENMGGGEVVYSLSVPADWEPVAFESVNDGLWKRACGKQ